jgi:hypothetical protein
MFDSESDATTSDRRSSDSAASDPGRVPSTSGRQPESPDDDARGTGEDDGEDGDDASAESGGEGAMAHATAAAVIHARAYQIEMFEASMKRNVIVAVRVSE